MVIAGYRLTMITAEQIELVRESFAAVLPFTAQASVEFYRQLFLLAPDAEALFHGDMDEQGRKLFLTLAAIVDSLDRLDAILPVAEALAVRHVAYGVQDTHYDAAGAALLGTLRIVGGPAFDDAADAAWSAAYQLLAARMIAAAQRSIAA